MEGSTKSTKVKIGDIVTIIRMEPIQYEVIDLQAHGECLLRLPGDLKSWGFHANEWWLENITSTQNTEQ